MRNFDWKILYGLISRDLIWIRIAGLKYGIAIKRTKMLFLERNGFTWYLPLPCGWRFTVLRAKGA